MNDANRFGLANHLEALMKELEAEVTRRRLECARKDERGDRLDVWVESMQSAIGELGRGVVQLRNRRDTRWSAGIVDGCLPEMAPHFDAQGGRCGGVTIPDPPPPNPPPPPSEAGIIWRYEVIDGLVEWWMTLRDEWGETRELSLSYRRSTGQVVTRVTRVEP